MGDLGEAAWGLPDSGSAGSASEESMHPYTAACVAVIGARCLMVSGWLHDAACMATRQGDCGELGVRMLGAIHTGGDPLELLCVGPHTHTPKRQSTSLHLFHVPCRVSLARSTDLPHADLPHTASCVCLSLQSCCNKGFVMSR
jgi:hypothetical protein